jgi:hypothetical protein
MSTRRRPPVQASFFVSISNIYRSMAGNHLTCLMSIMAMASHGRQVFSLPLCCLCGEGI